MKAPLAIGIDLGGTNIKVAVVDSDGGVLHRLEQPTAADRGPGPVIDDLADLVRRLRQQAVVGIGLATPGPLDLSRARIIRGVNLPGWKDVPIREALREKTGLPVTLENDANAAAYGEYRFGAGQGRVDLVMLTLGTGVGCGVILNGQILHGHFGNAAELGHMIVVVDGLPCPCGQRGCLEQYTSADAVVRRVLQADPSREPNVGPPLVSSADQHRDRKEAGTVRAEDVARAATGGDAVCEGIWDEACLYLAVACVNIQHAFNPAKIVLGGGLSNAGAQLLDRVNAHFRKHVWSLHSDFPEIVLSKLGGDAGVIGAAMLAMP